MISKSQRDITEKVVSIANELEEEELGWNSEIVKTLDQYFQAGIGGTVREVTLITETGGPQIEINVGSGTVTGFNGGDSHTTHFRNEELQDELWDYWTSRYEDSR